MTDLKPGRESTKLEMGDFTIERVPGCLPISISHSTGGYYGCDSDYDLDMEEVEMLVTFLTQSLPSQDKGGG